MIVPIAGGNGKAFTLSVYVALAAAQGVPRGLLVVTVIIIVFPASPDAGV